MAVGPVVNAHYRAQQTISRRTAQQAQLLWKNVEPKSVLSSWRDQLAAMLGVLVRGQVAAASLANPYTKALATAQEIPADAVGAINPVAFAGTAADGRSLISLLMQPALRTLGLLTKGADDQTALLSGLASLTRIVDTEIADASRAADHVGFVGTRVWVKHIRHVSLPACGRCVVLAGQVYSWSQGFERHERCDCTMVPLREGDERPATPEQLFAAMTPKEQARSFTIAGAEAIRLGADLGQVVNARRGMKTVGDRLLTTEGITLRGFAGRRMGPGTQRLMPEQILADARGDRDLAVQLLERNGFLLAPSPAVARKRAEEKAAAEQARLESELAAEQARLDAEAAAERARAEAEAVAEQARVAAEQARIEAERIEAERLEAERVEAERVAAEHAAAVASAKAAMAKSRALARAETKRKKEAAEAARLAAEAAAKNPATRSLGMQAGLRHRTNMEGLEWAQRELPMPADLTKEERSGLRSYTGETYKLINNGLRGRLPTTKRDKERYETIVARCDAAFAKASTPEAMVVHRQVAADFAKFIGADVDRRESMLDLVGKDFVEKGYVSTSVGQSSPFPGAIHLMMRVPQGYKAMNVMPISQMDTSEREVLINRGSRYVVHAAYKVGHVWHIEAELVPEDWQKPADWTPDPYNDADEGYSRDGGAKWQ